MPIRKPCEGAVVICLKSLTFVVSVTTAVITASPGSGCDLLEKSYLCGISNNGQKAKHPKQGVVICLKSLTFVVSVTTNDKDVRNALML